MDAGGLSLEMGLATAHDPVMERIVWLGTMPSVTIAIHHRAADRCAAAETRRNELRGQRELLEREDTIK
jgi:hypothetical protein